MVQFAEYATMKRFKTWLNLKAGAQIYNSLHKSRDIGGYGGCKISATTETIWEPSEPIKTRDPLPLNIAHLAKQLLLFTRL